MILKTPPLYKKWIFLLSRPDQASDLDIGPRRSTEDQGTCVLGEQLKVEDGRRTILENFFMLRIGERQFGVL